MPCFQSVGDAKLNGQQSTQYMELVQVQIILGKDPQENARLHVCVWERVCLV